MASQTIAPSYNPFTPTLRTQGRKIAILGFGTVGSALARILKERNTEHFELTHIFNREINRKRVSWTGASIQWTDSFEDVLESDVEVVIELVGGIQPAKEWVVAALTAGKSVVTANKQLIARFGVELSELARQHGCHLLFGASLAGGVPAIDALQQGLAGDELQSVHGILNGTCNYILSKMEEGLPFPTALAEAQRLGFAEADPRDDLAGYDARAKLVILARTALRASLVLEDIPCSDISTVRPIDFVYARELGCTIRQVAEAGLSGSNIVARIEPVLVPFTSLLAAVRGCDNVVIASGKFGGTTALSGAGAGGCPTAVAVLSDLITIANGGPANTNQCLQEVTLAKDYIGPYYLRLVVNDRPGIIAHVTSILAKFEINVDAVLQKPGYSKEQLPFAVTVEACSTETLESALAEIARADFLVEEPLKLRIVGR